MECLIQWIWIYSEGSCRIKLEHTLQWLAFFLVKSWLTVYMQGWLGLYKSKFVTIASYQKKKFVAVAHSRISRFVTGIHGHFDNLRLLV